MAGTFQLKIATPEREIFNAPVESVAVPGSESPFGVLKNHAPIIAALDAGVVRIVDASGKETRMVIGGGFFQVADNNAMVLADSAELTTEIDVARAQEAEKRARARLSGQLEPVMEVQRTRAEAALKRSQVRLRNASGR
ncbi:MAG TPA: ATP synthase F1 subunit epsilon [Abditibacteriaceae bacterium]|jgi:F-type H+-transporting ATPase subunit epsilon